MINWLFLIIACEEKDGLSLIVYGGDPPDISTISESGDSLTNHEALSGLNLITSVFDLGSV